MIRVILGAGLRRIAASKCIPISVDLPRKAQTGASEAPGAPAANEGAPQRPSRIFAISAAHASFGDSHDTAAMGR